MSNSIEDELIAVARGWDRAMVENDAEAIGRFMADDWVIIGSDGRVDDKATFLRLVKSGSPSARSSGRRAFSSGRQGSGGAC